MELLHKIDIAIVGVSILVLLGLFGYAQPYVIAPVNGYETTMTDILFNIEKAESILIDDNADFSSPREYLVEEGLHIRLEPGTYYWKAKGVLKSEVHTLTVKTLIDLELQTVGDGGYAVRNSGNVAVTVDVYDEKTLTGQFDLVPYTETKTVGTKIEGGMK